MQNDSKIICLNSFSYEHTNKLIYANVIHIPYRAFRYDVTSDRLGLGQTSNFSWDKPNSNLGGPKLS